jgi:hypothetical protein
MTICLAFFKSKIRDYNSLVKKYSGQTEVDFNKLFSVTLVIREEKETLANKNCEKHLIEKLNF